MTYKNQQTKIKKKKKVEWKKPAAAAQLRCLPVKIGDDV